MPAGDTKVDVLVVGDHPCAYFAVALLGLNSQIRIAHLALPEDSCADRPVLVNPDFFDIHPLAATLRRRIRLQPIYGVDFVTDDRGIVIGHHKRSCVVLACRLGEVRREMVRLAKSTRAVFLGRRELNVIGVDETGIHAAAGDMCLRPRAMIVAAELPQALRRLLGIHEQWDRGVLHRYTYAELEGSALVAGGSRPVMPMSLDLGGLLRWAWAIPAGRSVLLAVEQPVETVQQHPPDALLLRWAEVLQRHGIIRFRRPVSAEGICRMDMPLAGALAHECLGNRTLLIGPAGGFYSACAEDVYPNCWSAVYAVETVKRALREKYLQDGLQPYRQTWRTTLGDYLRGPQQNLRFLLPLVYRNQAMADRVAQAILTSRSVVR